MVPPPPPKPDEPGVFEDLIEIFTAPAKVFARRAKQGGAALFFIVAIVLGALGYTAKPILEPIAEAQMTKAMAKAKADNPQMTDDQIATAKAMQMKIVGVTFMLGPAMALLFLGIIVWIVGKVFGAAVNFGSSMVIASLVWVPRIIGSVIIDIQALMANDTSVFTNQSQITLSPARFMDPGTTGAMLLTFVSRIDLLVIWSTILLGVAYMVAGKLPKSKAIAAAITVWAIPTLFALWGAARSG
jgi:hypothetical protein